jgi:hypothetical protein
MPRRKKGKPSFEIPQDVATAPQAGWVSRSKPPVEEPPVAEAVPAVESPKPVSVPTEIRILRPLWMPFAVFHAAVLSFIPSKTVRRIKE